MSKPTRFQLGGRATAKILRKAALTAYYKNPNVCRQCASVIRVSDSAKVGEVRRKRFCSHRCAALFNNPNRIPKGPIEIICSRCSKPFVMHKKYSGSKMRRYCEGCVGIARIIAVGKKPMHDSRTKGEIFGSARTWQSARSAVRQHAVNTFTKGEKPMTCFVCGYTRYVEVCHITAVAEFPSSATLGEINDLSNLIALCPNHHWEFDHGHLSLVAPAGSAPATSAV